MAKSFFGEWFEKAREKALGRIHIYPGRWVFCGNQMWQDQYPRIVRGKVYNYAVPWSVCRKCEFYQKSGDGIKFPRCLWKAKAQTVSEANSVAAQSIVDGIQKTAETVDKIFGAK